MIAVLTYDHHHRKTQDLLFALVANGNGYRTAVIATPWHERKNFVPLFPHRWFEPLSVDIEILCKRLGISFERVEDAKLPERLSAIKPEVVLIGGAGILPKKVLEVCPVVNSHPGYLPYVRGLDALKWAIYEQLPIGVTTYLVSAETDAGRLITRELVPVHYWDTFHSVAYRQYEMEIRMLAESMADLDRLGGATSTSLEELPPEGAPRRRMPHSLELKLFDRLRAIVDELVGEN